MRLRSARSKSGAPGLDQLLALANTLGRLFHSSFTTYVAMLLMTLPRIPRPVLFAIERPVSHLISKCKNGRVTKSEYAVDYQVLKIRPAIRPT